MCLCSGQRGNTIHISVLPFQHQCPPLDRHKGPEDLGLARIFDLYINMQLALSPVILAQTQESRGMEVGGVGLRKDLGWMS